LIPTQLSPAVGKKFPICNYFGKNILPKLELSGQIPRIIPITPAFFAAMLNMIPVFFPFFAPDKGTPTGFAELLRQIAFFSHFHFQALN
tara:strand:+ start:3489 stop:3755 length:267 start_codon:yes stop_codon:yes gene_type:complete